MRKGMLATISIALASSAVCGFFVGSRAGRSAELERQIARMNEQVVQLRTSPPAPQGDVAQQVQALGDQLTKMRDELRAATAEAVNTEPEDKGPSASVRTPAEAAELIGTLGTDPTADRLADCLSTLDSWTVRPENEKPLTDLKLQQAARLRQRVKQEVAASQKAALDATSGSEAIKRHSEAGRVLALYPMSDDRTVLDEAKILSAGQVELVGRIEVIRRQRYNRWAADRVAAAIGDYNRISSYLHPTSENQPLVEAIAADLGEVDPAVMEPAVLELYTYVLDLTKGSLNEQWKTELAKHLTAPSLRRKTLGDF